MTAPWNRFSVWGLYWRLWWKDWLGKQSAEICHYCVEMGVNWFVRRKHSQHGGQWRTWHFIWQHHVTERCVIWARCWKCVWSNRPKRNSSSCAHWLFNNLEKRKMRNEMSTNVFYQKCAVFLSELYIFKTWRFIKIETFNEQINLQVRIKWVTGGTEYMWNNYLQSW